MYLYNLSKILKPYHVPESAKGLFKAQITTIPTVSATLGCGLELTFLTSFQVNMMVTLFWRPHFKNHSLEKRVSRYSLLPDFIRVVRGAW